MRTTSSGPRRIRRSVVAALVLALVTSLFGAVPATAAPATSGDVTAPVDTGTYRMSSAQGPRCLPIIMATTWHNGQDLGGAVGNRLYAVADGVVTRAQPDSSAGQWITVRHVIDGVTITIGYSHVVNATQYVRAGQRVSQGQRIATMGNTGVSTSPHLHLEVWRGDYGGTLLDPETWFRQQGIDLRAGADLITQVRTPSQCRYYAQGTTTIYRSASTSSTVRGTVPSRTVLTSTPGASSGNFIQVRAGNISGWAPRANVTPTDDVYTQRHMLGDHDYTGDGVPDVLAVSASGALLQYPGNGRGGFLSMRRVGNGWTGFEIIATGDFNGDRRSDLVAVDASGRLFLYPGTGQGGFRARVQIGHGWGSFAHLFAVADFSGDQRTDLIAVDSTGRMFRYPGLGNGRVGARTQIGHGWGAFSTIMAGGDLNDDSSSDLIAVDSSGRLFVYYANSEGVMNAGQQIGQGWRNFTLVPVGDFNRDDYSDFLGINNTTGAAYLYRGDGKGRVGSAIQVGTGWASFIQVL
ncbi:peptidoglycan DD-metalloendopeptidase family protein [Occultella gossypii]|uniref:VCBS repeat domain-containing M23 family metallopeptidase n=1 Tax=Occultella gossypii TaxID=2800820 RepID=A0ABS7S8V5_9MICO|nr:peptidoglycan DD-metalloendopeptidase family protein [Occultella gossypii]MBZ2196784.1 VCBS repeat domain-containing M23 family metallopeptidase [Occultella gossypii]